MAENEERQELPTWKQKEIKLGENATITMMMDRPLANGSSQYGDWEMWKIKVENQPVFWKSTGKKQSGYTGEALMFPPPKMLEQIYTLIDGREGCVIKVTKTAEEGDKGKIFTNYPCEYIKHIHVDSISSSGPGNSQNVSNGAESELLSDCKVLMEQGTNIDEETFLEACKEKGISTIRGKVLYSELKKSITPPQRKGLEE